MIQPVAYQRKLEGKSNAHLITFDDGKDYVVKYFQPGFERSLPNEWVAYCLARYLGLPVPFAKIVEIPQEFTSQIPGMSTLNTTQSQFASVYIPNCLDGHQVPSIKEITNHQTLAGIIVFDYWLYNRDRTRKNILLQQENDGIYYLWAIDHAEIFGSYNWSEADLEQLPTQLIKSATHELMAKFNQNEQHYQEQLEIIQTLPILLIEEIVSLIPEDWMVTKEEKKAIVTTLLRRRKETLPPVIRKFIKKVNEVEGNADNSFTQ